MAIAITMQCDNATVAMWDKPRRQCDDTAVVMLDEPCSDVLLGLVIYSCSSNVVQGR